MIQLRLKATGLDNDEFLSMCVLKKIEMLKYQEHQSFCRCRMQEDLKQKCVYLSKGSVKK